LERELIDSPDKAPVIEQTGGLRKLRFAPPGSVRSKSGAYRVCYAYYPAYGTIALFMKAKALETCEIKGDGDRKAWRQNADVMEFLRNL
jgi:hypothetical protein